MDKDYLKVTYNFFFDEKRSLNLAKELCYEESVELSPHLIKEEYIHSKIVAKIIEFKKIKNSLFEATITFPFTTTTFDISQIINMLYGNISFKKGVRLTNIDGENLADYSIGPKYGIDGIRKELSIFNRPLLATSLKPLGKSVSELAKIAYQFASGGIDIIKDDHLITDQEYAPFKNRVKAVSEAIKNANQETGKNSLYIANINCEREKVLDRIYYAQEIGAKGVMIFPGITGFELAKKIVNDKNINLIIFAHPALLGNFIICKNSGISGKVLLAKFYRITGIDATIFPNYTGRFDISKKECININSGCKEEFGNLKKIFPMIGGGLKLNEMKKTIKKYDRDIIYLIGESLYSCGDDFKKSASLFLENISKEFC